MRDYSIWEILGISETSDEQEIRAAYIRVLPNFHPEDDPEGFQRLRKAYDDAIEFANGLTVDEEAEDISESGLIVAELKAVITDFPRRLDAAEWQAILDRDECAGIDIRTQIGEKLLVFLMDNPYLPSSIWRLLDSYFAWSSMVDYLKQSFPEGFIDYVMTAINYEEIIRGRYIDLSDPSADFEEFLQACYALNNALSSGDIEEADRLVAENSSHLFAHPDYRLALVRYYEIKEQHDKADEIIEDLLSTYADDNRTLVAYADVALARGRAEQALVHYERVLSTVSDYYQAKLGVSKAYFELGNFEKAKEKSLEMLMDYPFDENVGGVFYESSEKLIEVYEAALKENGNDQDIIYKLASCYFNTTKLAECESLIKDNIPDEAHIAKHAELLFDTNWGGIDDFKERAEEMAELLRTWERHETRRNRLRKLPQKYHALGMDELALEKAEIYLKEFPNAAEICVTMAEIYRDREDLTNGRRVVSMGLTEESSHPQLLAEMAMILCAEGNTSEAVGCAEESLRVYPYNGLMWDLVIGAYWVAEQMPSVLENIEAAEHFGYGNDRYSIRKATARVELGMSDDETIKILDDFIESAEKDDSDIYIALYSRGLSAYLCDDLHAAVNYLTSATESSEPLSAYFYLSKAYTEMGDVENAVKTADDAISFVKTDYDNYYDDNLLRSLKALQLDAYYRNDIYDKALALEDEVLDENGESGDSGVYINLAYCHYEQGEDDIAQSLYEKAEALDTENEEVLRKFGSFLRRGRHDVPAAILKYKAALEVEPLHQTYNLLGQCYDEIGERQLAIDCYMEAEKLIYEFLENREMPCLYYSLGEALFGLGRLDEAETALRRAVDTAGDYVACHKSRCHEADFILALLYRERGDMERAREQYKISIDVAPDREYMEQADKFGL